MEALIPAVDGALAIVVLLGASPLVMSCIQFLLIGRHREHAHYDRTEAHFPRTAIMVPAWNEGAVIGATVDRLMALEYPADALRVYVVDDASTDDTPDVLKAKERKYPGQVIHLRREKGGQGKAHTLNHGLAHVLKEDWCEAVLIIDADVLFEADALRKMSRHLADRRIGAVTAYIKEGSEPGNYLTRFIAYEYVTAQAAARRGQNVLGAMACLAGGAQLHSRESLLAIGGAIDTGTLAEDTVTTFRTQLEGRRALFDGNATVWAEEPGDVIGLWKQRLRWARGNLQLTRRFRHLWFRRGENHGLGGVTFGLLWFTLLLMPLLMIGGSAALVTLFFVDFGWSWTLFRALWIASALTYLFVTFYAFTIDPAIARRAWLQGLLYPGVVSLVIIAYSLYPPILGIPALARVTPEARPDSLGVNAVVLLLYAWLALCMAVGYGAKLAAQRERHGLARALVYAGGYGPLLCAVSLASYVSELKGSDLKWDKTVKTGKVALPK
jgi:cellulose synthase/poly-beta-1,6-N-acetylglucosamine synthase-like glycosyltransferase